MNASLFNHIMSSSNRVTRRVTYKDFTDSQLEEIRKKYLEKRYLNVAETAIVLGVCAHTVYRLNKRGKIVLNNEKMFKAPFLIDIQKTIKVLDIHY